MMLTVEGLETYYGPSQALFGVTFEVAAGEVVTLMGRNGMGKTTTIHSIMGLIPSAAGRVAFEGQHVSRDPVEEPAVVADDDGATREFQERFFQRPQRVDVQIVGRFVEQEHVGAALQDLGQMHAVALAA